jgi:hypothetical protein
MSTPLSLKQYGEIIKYSDEFKRIIDLGDDEDTHEVLLMSLSKKYCEFLIITAGITEYDDILLALVHKTNLNGKFNVYDHLYIKKGEKRVERFTQMKFYNEEQSDKYWIVPEDVLYESIENILNESEGEIKTAQAKAPVISPDKFVLPENSQDASENEIYINTPFDYCNDYDGDEFDSEINFIIKIVTDLYAEDPYRVKEGIRELYGITKCRNRARQLAANDAEFNALDQAMNFFYLTHFQQKKKREQALKIVSDHYKVSSSKIESIWNSLVNYKRHIGNAMDFKKKNYKKSPL